VRVVAVGVEKKGNIPLKITSMSGKGRGAYSAIIPRSPHTYTTINHRPHQESTPLPYTGNATRECFYQRLGAAAAATSIGRV